MNKSKLHQSFLLCLILIGSLLLLYFIPEFSIGAWKFKQVDLLSDVKTTEEDIIFQAVQDSITVKQDSVVRLVEEHCRPGLTCIEDYSGDSTALKAFFTALAETKKSGKRIRIAFYGDSFIEGDVFCGSFRDTLQSIFGGQGVGYVPITSTVTGFRNTIKHSFDNWQTSSWISKRDSSVALGPAGYSFVPQVGNWVQYKTSKQRFLREFNTVRLYYTNSADAAVQYTIDKDTTYYIDELKTSNTLQEWNLVENKVNSIRFEFYPHDSLKLYGACFESKEGLYVDNFSMRGNSGISLNNIDDKILKKFSEYRNYKLIILQFGLNLVVEDSLNYRAYTKKMVEVVNKMKKAFPKSSFLLLSVSDRSSNKTGRLKTINAIPAMRNAQREIAQKTKIAFWDMFEAMGGENSMVEFAHSRPPLAAKDYTHLTFKGGKKLASALAKSLLFEAEKFENRQKKK
jgi:lysophospholipase L1-like esterase